MMDGLDLLLLFACGVVSGTLNVLAGGGSFLSLPILMMLGLPPTLANGTNRVAILLQNAGAVWGFNRHGVMEWNLALWAALPAAAGSIVGTLAALAVGDDAFRRILALLMVAVSLWTLFDPLRRRSAAAREGGAKPKLWALALGFFAVGAYGGFVQAGVGFLILAALSLAGLDLVRGNALKVLVILVFTVLSLAIFAWQGQVAWVPGLALAMGSLLGGQLGVRWTVLKGHRWLRGFVTVMVIVFAVKLWFWP